MPNVQNSPIYLNLNKYFRIKKLNIYIFVILTTILTTILKTMESTNFDLNTSLDEMNKAAYDAQVIIEKQID